MTMSFTVELQPEYKGTIEVRLFVDPVVASTSTTACWAAPLNCVK